MKDFCIQAGVEMGELCGGTQRRAVAEVRSNVAYRLNQEMGIPMGEIARYLGGLRLSPWQFGKKKE